MQDTFQWTPELLADFFNSIKILPVDLANGMDEFKQSKSPKKEWEIVAYRFEPLIGTFPKDIIIGPDSPHWLKEPNEEFTIHSIHRLSDDWTVSVKDRVKTLAGEIGIIKSFDATGHILFENIAGLEHITSIQKLPAAILTTADGKELIEGDNLYYLDNCGNIIVSRAGEGNRNEWKDKKCFSTREAAEEYILNNKPLLSLNDVKGACRSTVFIGETFLIEKLTAIAKQKLKQ